MGLINELQEVAEQGSATETLRKAKRACTKLNETEILDWVNRELNGYPDKQNLPKYRRGSGTLCYNTNGYIPAGFGHVKSGISPLSGFGEPVDYAISEPISTVMEWIRAYESGKGLYVPVTQKTGDMIKSKLISNFPEAIEQITILLQVDESFVRDIPEQVNNAVLDWACALEMAGVQGESHTFSQEEKTSAGGVSFNFHNSSIESFASASTNSGTAKSNSSKTTERDQQIESEPLIKSRFLSKIGSAYGLIGTGATIFGAVIGWFALHKQYGWWFFGL